MQLVSLVKAPGCCQVPKSACTARSCRCVTFHPLLQMRQSSPQAPSTRPAALAFGARSPFARGPANGPPAACLPVGLVPSQSNARRKGLAGGIDPFVSRLRPPGMGGARKPHEPACTCPHKQACASYFVRNALTFLSRNGRGCRPGAVAPKQGAGEGLASDPVYVAAPSSGPLAHLLPTGEGNAAPPALKNTGFAHAPRLEHHNPAAHHAA